MTLNCSTLRSDEGEPVWEMETDSSAEREEEEEAEALAREEMLDAASRLKPTGQVEEGEDADESGST